MDTSRHWVEVQLPQPSNEGDTIGFYVIGNTGEIEDHLFPVLMTPDVTKDYMPCKIIAIESTE